MFCPSCGHKNVDEAKFCAKCGASVHVQTVPVSPVSPPIASPGVASTVPNGMKWGIVAGSVIFPLVGIVMGIIYMRDANPDKKAVGKLWLGVGIGMVLLYLIIKF